MPPGKEKKIMRRRRGRGREKQIKTAPTEQTRSIPVRPAAGRSRGRSGARRTRAWQRWLYMSWTSLDGVLAVVALPS